MERIIYDASKFGSDFTGGANRNNGSNNGAGNTGNSNHIGGTSGLGVSAVMDPTTELVSGSSSAARPSNVMTHLGFCHEITFFYVSWLSRQYQRRKS